MAFVSTKMRRWIATILLLSIVALYLSGCTLRNTSIFSEEITMQCDAPYMITTYIKAENGAGSRETYLEIDGEVCKVELYYRGTLFVVKKLDPLTLEGEVLLLGSWKERKGNLFMHIREDYIFDNQYEKIVLKPVDSSLS